MDIKELKTYIFENDRIEQILESINCHHLKYHSSGEYWTCANANGDNNSAILIYCNENLPCINYTRKMIDGDRNTDIIDLVCYTKQLKFTDSLKFICNTLGISYYHDFEEDIPESLKIIKLIDEMSSNVVAEKEEKLKPISENILGYYKPYVNDLFCEDGIDYCTQKEFEIGFDEYSNRYTIPIRSEIGDLVGVKGRYFYRDVPEDKNKYIYLESCPKSKILYGLYKTMPHILLQKKVYVLEAEKAVMQLWSYGYMNTVSVGGKDVSNQQVNLLVRLGVDIVLCFDKDVKKEEYEIVANKFPEMPIYYMFDEDNLLGGKESPSDNSDKWTRLVKNNVYRIK